MFYTCYLFELVFKGELVFKVWCDFFPCSTLAKDRQNVRNFIFSNSKCDFKKEFLDTIGFTNVL